MHHLAVIGGGAMGGALVGGLLEAGQVTADALTVAEIDSHRREVLVAQHGVGVTSDPAAAVRDADVVVVAVKPRDVQGACERFGPALRPGATVLSIAAGVPSCALERWLPDGTSVVRAMPNTPALVGSGAAAIAAGEVAGPEALDAAEAVLSSVGVVVRVPEAQLDAVTAVSGSGPAYVFLLAEAMVDAATELGLPHDVAAILVENTIVGAAALLAQSELPPADLRAQVTSPGGTTAAALAVLEERRFRAALAEAMRAATARSTELGKET